MLFGRIIKDTNYRLAWLRIMRKLYTIQNVNLINARDFECIISIITACITKYIGLISTQNQRV